MRRIKSNIHRIANVEDLKAVFSQGSEGYRFPECELLHYLDDLWRAILESLAFSQHLQPAKHAPTPQYESRSTIEQTLITRDPQGNVFQPWYLTSTQIDEEFIKEREARKQKVDEKRAENAVAWSRKRRKTAKISEAVSKRKPSAPSTRSRRALEDCTNTNI